MQKPLVLVGLVLGSLGLTASPALAQGLPRFGVAASAGTLGVGVQAATALSRSTNLRFGFNYFSYSAGFDKDQIHYDGKLRLESAEILVDQYIAGPIHISSGFMVYDGNQGTGNASVPGGQSFTLGGQQYFSDTASPVSGTGSIKARKYAPEILLGFGNLLPRSARHFTANFEIGVAFQGSPNALLNLTGNTCVTAGKTCGPIASNPQVQSSIQSEQSKINNDLAPFKYYPIVRLSFGVKF